MKFFSKKKDEKKLTELPPLKFPEFPGEQMIPSSEKIMYDDESDRIKEAVTRFPPPMEQQEREYEERQFDMGRMQEPILPNKQQGQTLFVRIENFNDAKEKMEKIREKLGETERILHKIDQLRKDEETELNMWHQDLNSIKSKLLEIDRKIFD